MNLFPTGQGGRWKRRLRNGQGGGDVGEGRSLPEVVWGMGLAVDQLGQKSDK